MEDSSERARRTAGREGWLSSSRYFRKAWRRAAGGDTLPDKHQLNLAEDLSRLPRVDSCPQGANIVVRELLIMRWRHQGVHSVATVAVSGTDSPTYIISFRDLGLFEVLITVATRPVRSARCPLRLVA